MEITNRERKFIVVGLGFFVCMILFFAFDYIKTNILSIDDKIKNALLEEKRLEYMGHEYKKLASLRSSEKIDLEPMIPQIESLLQKYGVRNNATFHPSDSVIENKYVKRLVSIDFREIDSTSLLSIIREIEDHSNIPYFIEFFQYSELSTKPGLYRVSLKIAAFKNKDNR